MRVPDVVPTVEMGVGAPSVQPVDTGFTKGIRQAGRELEQGANALISAGFNLYKKSQAEADQRELETSYANARLQAHQFLQDNVFSLEGSSIDSGLNMGNGKMLPGVTGEGYTLNVKNKLAEIAAANAPKRAGARALYERVKPRLLMSSELSAMDHISRQTKVANLQSAGALFEASQKSAGSAVAMAVSVGPDGKTIVDPDQYSDHLNEAVSAGVNFYKRQGKDQATAEQLAYSGVAIKTVSDVLYTRGPDAATAVLNQMLTSEKTAASLSPEAQNKLREGIQRRGEELATEADKVGQHTLLQEVVAGKTDVSNLTVDQLTKRGIKLENAVKIINEDSKAVPPMTTKLMADAFTEVANTKDDPVSGMTLARKLDKMGFRRETDKALFRVFDDKFNPTANGTQDRYSSQFAFEKAKLTGLLTEASDPPGWWNTNPLGDPKEKTSEFNGLLARELDGMDNFVKERIKKGVPYEKAIVEYWDLPNVKALVAQKDVRLFVNKALTAGASTQSAQVSKGRSILQGDTNSTPAQVRMYNIPDADARLMGIY